MTLDNFFQQLATHGLRLAWEGRRLTLVGGMVPDDVQTALETHGDALLAILKPEPDENALQADAAWEREAVQGEGAKRHTKADLEEIDKHAAYLFPDPPPGGVYDSGY